MPIFIQACAMNNIRPRKGRSWQDRVEVLLPQTVSASTLILIGMRYERLLEERA